MSDDKEVPPFRQVRAQFDADTVTVYQAYSPEIADRALAAGTFVPPFKLDRMTWIKPSFLWMMYRSGWATKPGQERILAIRLTRRGFEEALASASLSHFDADIHTSHDDWLRSKEASPVRVQWDPERDLRLQPLPWRAIQIGLGGRIARRYVGEWITGITDVTDLAQATRRLLDHGDVDVAARNLPREEPYRLPVQVASTIGASEER